MNKYAWIFFSVFLAGMFAVVITVLQQEGRTLPVTVQEIEAQLSIQVMTVPPERGEDIASSLRTVLGANRKEGEPIGQVSLPAPNQLMILAPRHLQTSIAEAVSTLGGKGAAVEQNAIDPAPVRFELWVVDAAAGGSAKMDLSLAPIEDALQASRTLLGDVDYRLYDRGIVSGAMDSRGNLGASTGLLQASFANLRPLDQGVRARISAEIIDPAGGTQRMTGEISLSYGQSTVLALFSGRASGNAGPDRLLIVRATPIRA